MCRKHKEVGRSLGHGDQGDLPTLYDWNDIVWKPGSASGTQGLPSVTRGGASSLVGRHPVKLGHLREKAEGGTKRDREGSGWRAFGSGQMA